MELLSLPRELARLSASVLNSTVNVLRLVIWVPVGLLLLILGLGIGGSILGSALGHLATYWWVYVLVIVALALVVVCTWCRDTSDLVELTSTVAPPLRALSQSRHGDSLPQSRAPGERLATGKPVLRAPRPDARPQTRHGISQPQPRPSEKQPAAERPTSGYALFRYTEEWLTRYGMYTGGDISKVDAVKIAGRTAISYHLREGNFVERDGRIGLTAKGKLHFMKRRSRL